MIEIKVADGVTLQLQQPSAILEMLTGEDRVMLIEQLSCHDEVIKHVWSQIKEHYGMTENGFSGWESCGDYKYTGGGSVINIAQYEIARSASELSAKTINKQAEIIKSRDAEINKLKQLINPVYRDI